LFQSLASREIRYSSRRIRLSTLRASPGWMPLCEDLKILRWIERA